MDVIDSDVPVLSMHSPWEVTSKADIYEARRGYGRFCATRRKLSAPARVPFPTRKTFRTFRTFRAFRKSVRFTRMGSQVRILYRPPSKPKVRTYVLAFFFCAKYAHD